MAAPPLPDGWRQVNANDPDLVLPPSLDNTTELPRVEWNLDQATANYVVTCYRGPRLLVSMIVTNADTQDPARLGTLLAQLQAACRAAWDAPPTPVHLNEE